MNTGLKLAESKISTSFQDMFLLLSEHNLDEIVKVKNYLAGQLNLIPRGQVVALGQYHEIAPLHDKVLAFVNEKMFNYRDAFQIDSGAYDEVGQPRKLTFLPSMVFCKKYDTKGSSVGHIALYMLEEYIKQQNKQVTSDEQTN